MAFKTPSKGMTRSKGLQTKKPLQVKSSFTVKPQSPLDQIKAQKKALQAATIRALEKAKREAAEQGVELSEWENEFIEGVTERVKTYGRAFADPDKGAMNGTLSLRQGMKLKEIRKKAQKGKDKDDAQ
ncbi:hypothetical protein [Asticcacaulis sp.]|uniref:hypothetical protein n=1 Tax=Asticcacaulis sp. TaxID=1872648 RepID=UPI002CC940CF|nr:hypothetical protein [Asticcacaulis sp.]HTM83137.1 hypothetical protein [Asticcacaulis sp.]